VREIEIQLRQVVESDYSIFFEHHAIPYLREWPLSSRRIPMRAKLAARWKRSLADESTMARTIVEGGQVVGFVATS